MSKVKDKTNILVIMESLARQLFSIQIFGKGQKEVVSKKVKILKQAFNSNPSLKRQLKIRKLIQQLSVKNKQSRQKLIQYVISISKKIQNSKQKKKLIQQIDSGQSFWVKPNKLQQRIGNVLNNSKYYGMNFYKNEQLQSRQILRQWFMRKNTIDCVQNKDLEKLCQEFNNKYTELPQGNKKLVMQMFDGSQIDQKRVLREVSELKQKLTPQGKKKLQYIVQNVGTLDKFDKVFILTSILQEN